MREQRLFDVCFFRHVYRQQQGFFSPSYRIVDFYLNDHNLVIEIDGPYHGPVKDRARAEAFTKAGGFMSYGSRTSSATRRDPTLSVRGS